MALALRSNW